MAERISVIVSTFNRPDALGAVLRALAGQTDREFEVVVADDGSGPATREAIERYRSVFGDRLKHVWHDDKGFRLAEIRNRAIRASGGDYLVFLDGDCLTRLDFVAAHRQLAQPGWFVSGNRILLSPQLTHEVLMNGLAPETWGAVRLVRERLRGGINRFFPMMRLPDGRLRRLNHSNWLGVRGANLAISRSDLEKVDGFDASFTSWGLEDSDLVVRLLNAGVRRKDGRFATGVLHLWHPEASRSALIDNQHRLDETLRSARVRAERGLSHLAGAS